MIDQATLIQYIPQAISAIELDWPYARGRGKVRDLFSLPDGRRLLVATDLSPPLTGC